MKNPISTFNFNTFPVRIHVLGSEPFFCLLDIATVLGLGNRSVSKFKFNPKGVEKLSTPTTSGMQEMIFINEPNLYRVIFRSNKVEAEEFQNWVFEEVLPQIRNTGRYSQNTAEIRPLTEPKFPFEFTEYELEQLVWLWCSHQRMNTLLGELITPLESLGSRFSPTVYSQHHEYKRLIDTTTDVINRLAEPFQHSKRRNWISAIHLINKAVIK